MEDKVEFCLHVEPPTPMKGEEAASNSSPRGEDKAYDDGDIGLARPVDYVGTELCNMESISAADGQSCSIHTPDELVRVSAPLNPALRPALTSSISTPNSRADGALVSGVRQLSSRGQGGWYRMGRDGKPAASGGAIHDHPGTTPSLSGSEASFTQSIPGSVLSEVRHDDNSYSERFAGPTNKRNASRGMASRDPSRDSSPRNGNHASQAYDGQVQIPGCDVINFNSGFTAPTNEYNRSRTPVNLPSGMSNGQLSKFGRLAYHSLEGSEQHIHQPVPSGRSLGPPSCIQRSPSFIDLNTAVQSAVNQHRDSNGDGFDLSIHMRIGSLPRSTPNRDGMHDSPSHSIARPPQAFLGQSSPQSKIAIFADPLNPGHDSASQLVTASSMHHSLDNTRPAPGPRFPNGHSPLAGNGNFAGADDCSHEWRSGADACPAMNTSRSYNNLNYHSRSQEVKFMDGSRDSSNSGSGIFAGPLYDNNASQSTINLGSGRESRTTLQVNGDGPAKTLRSLKSTTTLTANPPIKKSKSAMSLLSLFSSKSKEVKSHKKESKSKSKSHNYHLTPLSELISQSFTDVDQVRAARDLKAKCRLPKGVGEGQFLTDDNGGEVDLKAVEDNLKQFQGFYKQYLEHGGQGGGRADEVHFVAMTVARHEIVSGKMSAAESVPMQKKADCGM